MLQIFLSIASIPLQSIMAIIVEKLDIIQDVARVLWFNHCRGKPLTS